jgi:hypothetical protein
MRVSKSNLLEALRTYLSLTFYADATVGATYRTLSANYSVFTSNLELLSWSYRWLCHCNSMLYRRYRSTNIPCTVCFTPSTLRSRDVQGSRDILALRHSECSSGRSHCLPSCRKFDPCTRGIYHFQNLTSSLSYLHHATP